MTILIIEDEKPLARALELNLNEAGFTTKVVFNGSDGIEAIEKETFDLIICDLIMPKMDGFTVLAILKEMKIKCPVVVLSNLSQKEDEKYAKDFGAKDFFIKSNTPIETIVERVRELLK
jgi:DNA-binding response OmpR family regulator